jgi:hypothetical protein
MVEVDLPSFRFQVHLLCCVDDPERFLGQDGLFD